jgi:hypothetical protein
VCSSDLTNIFGPAGCIAGFALKFFYFIILSLLWKICGKRRPSITDF